MIRHLALPLAAVAVALAAPAYAQTTKSMDVTTGADVSSSPIFDLSNNGGAAVGVYVNASPTIVHVDGRDTMSFRSDLGLRQYFGGQGREDFARGHINATHIASEHLTIDAGFGVGTSTSRSFSYGRSAVIDPSTGMPEAGFPGSAGGGLLIDPSLVGDPVRQNTVDAFVGLAMTPNQRSSFSLSARNSFQGYTGAKFVPGTLGRTDSIFTTLSASYGHSVSPHTSVAVSLLASKADFLRTPTGDGTIFTPMAGLHMQLSPTMTFSLSGGISFTRSRLPIGVYYKRQSLALEGQLCDRGQNSNMCLGVSQQAQPSSLGQIGTSTEASFSYDRKLSHRDSWGLSASYGRNKIPTALLVTSNDEVYSAATHFSRQLSDRVSGFISASVGRINGVATNDRTDVRGGIGLTFRFGDRK